MDPVTAGGPDSPSSPARLAIPGGVLVVLALLLLLAGAGGYRSGFAGVFLPLAIVSGAAAWVALSRRPDRSLWVAVFVVVSATVAGLLVSAAPPSRGVLLGEARDLVPPFYTEVSATTSGHSWCRPSCPGATLTLEPPGVGASAVMVEIATPLFRQGLLTQEQLAAISRQRAFTVTSDDVRYRVVLEDEPTRRVVLSLTAR